jgi:hypothetical protein
VVISAGSFNLIILSSSEAFFFDRHPINRIKVRHKNVLMRIFFFITIPFFKIPDSIYSMKFRL